MSEGEAADAPNAQSSASAYVITTRTRKRPLIVFTRGSFRGAGCANRIAHRRRWIRRDRRRSHRSRSRLQLRSSHFVAQQGSQTATCTERASNRLHPDHVTADRNKEEQALHRNDIRVSGCYIGLRPIKRSLIRSPVSHPHFAHLSCFSILSPPPTFVSHPSFHF